MVVVFFFAVINVDFMVYYPWNKWYVSLIFSLGPRMRRCVKLGMRITGSPHHLGRSSDCFDVSISSAHEFLYGVSVVLSVLAMMAFLS